MFAVKKKPNLFFDVKMPTGSDAATAETMLVSLAADSQLKTVTSFFPFKAKREVVFKDSHKWLQVCLRLKKQTLE